VSTPTETAAALVAALGDHFRAIVREELARAGVTSLEYSTDALPIGVTRRTFASWCRSGRVPGARRDGRGWRCSRSAWRSARAGEGEPKKASLRVVSPEDDLDGLLAAAGLRSTRGGAR